MRIGFLSIMMVCAPLLAICQNVGIGTTTPSARLDVKTSTNYVAQFNGGSGMYVGLVENDVYKGYLGSYAGNPDDVDFGTGSGNNSGRLHLTIQAVPKMTIAANGMVGIGTTLPNSLLHIHGGDLFLQSSHGVFRLGYAGGNEWQMATTGGGADLRWYTTTDGGTTIVPRHYFEQNGDMGIGGFSGGQKPNARLEVIGEGDNQYTNLLMLRSANGDTLLRMRNDGRTGWGYNGPSYGRTLNLGGTGINFYTGGRVFGGAIFPTDTSLVIWSNSNSDNYVVLQPAFGNTGIGTYTPNAKLHLNGAMLIGNNFQRTATGYMLSVDGKIIAEDVVIQNSTAWPDYVFESNYPLLSLEELDKWVRHKKHLPNIPSAADLSSNNQVSLAEMNRKLLEKVEELTLYIIQANKENKLLEERVSKLENLLNP